MGFNVALKAVIKSHCLFQNEFDVLLISSSVYYYTNTRTFNWIKILFEFLSNLCVTHLFNS